MVDIYIYRKVLKKISLTELKRYINNKSYTIWIDVSDPKDEDFQKIMKFYKIHNLVIEDISRSSLLPKIEEFLDYYYVVLSGHNRTKKVEHIQMNYILTSNTVMSIYHGHDDMYLRLKEQKEQLITTMHKGVGYLLHSLIDMQVDNYFPLVEEIEERIESIEDDAMNANTPDVVHPLFHIKRNLFYLKKLISTQKDVIAHFTKGNVPLISEDSVAYFRNIYDHLVLLNNMVDSNRETIISIIELHLSMLSNKTNEVMKVLTVIATIVLPMTAIASVYGMNFRYMPELEWHYGYPATWGIMIFITIAMLFYFRRKKWI